MIDEGKKDRLSFPKSITYTLHTVTYLKLHTFREVRLSNMPFWNKWSWFTQKLILLQEQWRQNISFTNQENGLASPSPTADSNKTNLKMVSTLYFNDLKTGILGHGQWSFTNQFQVYSSCPRATRSRRPAKWMFL